MQVINDQSGTGNFCHGLFSEYIFNGYHGDDSYKQIKSDSWPVEEFSEADLNDAVATFSNQHDQVGIFEPKGINSVVMVAHSHGTIYVYALDEDIAGATAGLEWAKNRFPKKDLSDERKASISFWYYTPQGPNATNRTIDVPVWDDIKNNYTKSVKDNLIPLYETKEWQSENGQLILWSGEPGTGKTFALRSLASAWKDWCDFHYITDPDKFFGDHADYMIRVLLDSAHDDKWKVLILEDAGEMLKVDARKEVGQALSRLLNVVDGIIGQGLKVLVIVTTNEEMGKLHPAMVRSGRCAQKLEFKPLTAEEVEEWGATHGVTPDKPLTIAQLYAKLNGTDDSEEESKVGF